VCEFGGLPNVVLTPHVAGVTEEGMMRMAQVSAEEILRVLEERRRGIHSIRRW